MADSNSSATAPEAGEERRKPFEIIVNAQPKSWDAERIDFEQVVHLAYPSPPPGGTPEYTVTYSKGPPRNPQGTLLPGQSVFVKNRMVFDVVPTVKS